MCCSQLGHKGLAGWLAGCAVLLGLVLWSHHPVVRVEAPVWGDTHHEVVGMGCVAFAPALLQQLLCAP